MEFQYSRGWIYHYFQAFQILDPGRTFCKWQNGSPSPLQGHNLGDYTAAFPLPLPFKGIRGPLHKMWVVSFPFEYHCYIMYSATHDKRTSVNQFKCWKFHSCLSDFFPYTVWWTCPLIHIYWSKVSKEITWKTNYNCFCSCFFKLQCASMYTNL